MSMLIVDQYGNSIKEEDYPVEDIKLDGSWVFAEGRGVLEGYTFSMKSHPMFQMTEEHAKTSGMYFNGVKIYP